MNSVDEKELLDLMNYQMCNFWPRGILKIRPLAVFERY